MTTDLALTPLVLVGGMSRSGTTLLSAVLDAHPDVSAGAELIPVPIPDLAEFARVYREARDITDDFAFVGRTMRRMDEPALGGIVTRTYRAGLSVEQFESVLNDLRAEGQSECVEFMHRLDFAVRLIAARVAEEAVKFGSFKLNSPSMLPVLKHYVNARVLFLVRHPTAVAHSQLTKGFSSDAMKVCEIWQKYVTAAQLAENKFPSRFAIVRYEDLVEAPEVTLKGLFQRLSLPFSVDMLKYQDHKSAIFESRHPNTEQLVQGFQRSGVEINRAELSDEVVGAVRSISADALSQFGYEV